MKIQLAFYINLLFLLNGCKSNNNMESNYRVIEPQEYLETVNNSNCEYLYEVDFNKSSLYKVGEVNYMVLPLASTEPGIISSNREYIDFCIKNQFFEVPNNTKNIYSSNSQQIRYYLNNPVEATTEILAVLACSEFNSKTIDSYVNHVGKKNIKKKYLIDFYFFAGEIIIKRNKGKWILLKNYLGLNPYYIPTIIDSKCHEYSIVSFVDEYLSTKMSFEELISQTEIFKLKKPFLNPTEIILPDN